MAMVVPRGTAPLARGRSPASTPAFGDEVVWRTFLTSLNKRGLAVAKLVVPDQPAGPVSRR
jgi:hypothetical protein